MVWLCFAVFWDCLSIAKDAPKLKEALPPVQAARKGSPLERRKRLTVFAASRPCTNG